jgi:hypothetical protein
MSREQILKTLRAGNIEDIKVALDEVKELDLSSCMLTEKQVCLLAEVLKTNSCLTELDLGMNNIGAAGAAALGEALETNSTLKQLDLGDNQIGDAGAIALGECLKTNSTLDHLELGDNQIGDAGATALGEALETNSTLMLLEIHANQIGLKGRTAIANSIARNKALATYKTKLGEAQETAIKAVTANTIDIKEAHKAVCQYQLAIKQNPAPDLFQIKDNNDINKYINSNYFWLIGVCKAIEQANPLSLLVGAKDCMAHILSFLKPTSLFPELLTPTDLLPTSFSCITGDKPVIGSVVEEADS